jgi:hypothetical protein
MWLIFLCATWYTYGLGYLISLLMDRGGVVGATAIGLVLGGIFNGAEPPLASIPDGDPMKIIDQFSFTRWAERLGVARLAAPGGCLHQRAG